jgi:hypothetical protein
MTSEWEKEQDEIEDPFLQEVYQFRIQQAEFITDWLEEFQSNLE